MGVIVYGIPIIYPFLVFPHFYHFQLRAIFPLCNRLFPLCLLYRPRRMPEKLFQWIRSSDMTYVNMLVHETALHDFLDKIGTQGTIQFTDVVSFYLSDF